MPTLNSGPSAEQFDFFALPKELQLLVCDSILSPADLAAAVGTCRWLRNRLQDRLYHDVCLNNEEQLNHFECTISENSALASRV